MRLGTILAIIGALGALTGISVWNYRRFMPAARPLGEKRYKVKKTVLPVTVGSRTIYGELLTPEGEDGPFPVVICSHGYGSSYRLTKNCIGKPLAMSGYAAYCFDFCGGSQKSKSTGRFHDMTIFTERDDLLAVIDRIKALPNINPDRLYLLGESQGGMISAITATERIPDIKAMVLYYPAFCIPYDAHEKFAAREEIPDEVEAFKLKIGGGYYRSVWDFDVYGHIAKFDKPVLILHGDHDEVVPISYGKKGAEVYPNADFITFPGEIHGFYGKGKRRAAEESYRFFEAHP